MAQKNSMSIESFKSLCDFDGAKYVSKMGKPYIDALSNLFPLNNKNDKPFLVEDIIKQPLLKDFTFSGVNDFQFICKLKARPLVVENDKRKNEKIEAFDFPSAIQKKIYNSSLGVAYIMTCVIEGKEHIIKIGCSRTTFQKRLGSYNCGTVNNWRTASTTNIKILQSMVTTRQTFNLYLCECGSEETYTWHGVTSVPFASSKIYAIEDIMIKKFSEQFGDKPLANVQANATEI